MRLYDASSCTPSSSKWEKSARQRPQPLSFVPVTSAPSNSNARLQNKQKEKAATRSDDNERDDGNDKQNVRSMGNSTPPSGSSLIKLARNDKSRQHQDLFKTASNTTSTTGGETPPFDNTTLSTPSQSSAQDTNRVKDMAVYRSTHWTSQDLNRSANTTKGLQHPFLRSKGLGQLQQTGQASLRPGVREPRKWQKEYSRTQMTKNEIVDDGVGVSVVTDEDDDDDTMDDMESSCSTLTTTRSMMMQQQNQEDVRIISSRRVNHRTEKQPSQISLPNAGPPVRQVPIQKTGNTSSSRCGAFVENQSQCIEDPLPPISVPGEDASGHSQFQSSCLTKKKKGRGDWNLGPSEARSGHSSKVSSQEAAGRAPTDSAKLSLPSPIAFCGRTKSSDQQEIAKSIQGDRIDFFPMHIPLIKDTENDDAFPRLGASGRFPSLGRHPSTSSGEESWNPFHDDLDENCISDVNDSSWVNFGDIQSSGAWIGSEWVAAESPVSFPRKEVEGVEANDNSIAALLDDSPCSYGYEENNDSTSASLDQLVGGSNHGNKENHLHSGTSFNDANPDPQSYRDIQKTMTRGIEGDGKSRKQTPKLLGPLLEKRFTRSYWRRFRGGKKDFSTTGQPKPKKDFVALHESNEAQSKVIAKLHQEQSLSRTNPVTDHSNWWDAAPHDGQKMLQIAKHENQTFAPDDSYTYLKSDKSSARAMRSAPVVAVVTAVADIPAVAVRSAAGGTHVAYEEGVGADLLAGGGDEAVVEALAVGGAGVDCASPLASGKPGSLVLSPVRLSECRAVLDSLDLTPEKLLMVIDAADASSQLKKEQIMSLRTLIPTREERRLLLRHVKKSRRQSLMFQFADIGENFLFQMIGVEKVQRKLAALLFQDEFHALVRRLREGYLLLWGASEEIIQSSKLEKVLGIINMLQNRMVGRTPGYRKASKVSLRSLEAMQAEAEGPPENATSEPFLVNACTRIQQSKPSLLNIREDLPSLQRAVEGGLKWDTLRLELEALEARFEAFREFAISLSTGNANATNRISGMTVQDEIDVLSTTSVGEFAVSACVEMAEIYGLFDSTQKSYDDLVRFVVEEKDESAKPTLTTILAAFASFVSFLEQLHEV